MADDAPGASRPPAPRRESLSDEEELSPSAYLFSGDSGSDREQSTRVMVPPPPPQDPRAMNVMDANPMFLERQERELSVNLRGRAVRDYARGLSDGGSAAGEENEVSSPCRFVALSELIVPQPPADDQPAAAAAQAHHSVAEAATAPAPTTAERAQICRSCRRWTAATPWVRSGTFASACPAATTRPPGYAAWFAAPAAAVHPLAAAQPAVHKQSMELIGSSF